LAVAAHKANTATATDTFDNVTVTGAADTTPPAISGITVGAVSVNGTNISWTTNEPASSQIDYGTTTSYGSSTAVNGTLDTAHSQVLPLAPPILTAA
jgi:hypothetical protein